MQCNSTVEFLLNAEFYCCKDERTAQASVTRRASKFLSIPRRSCEEFDIYKLLSYLTGNTAGFSEVTAVEPEDHREAYALYKTVDDCASFGIYEVKPARGGSDRWIVSAPNSNQTLLLASNDAREAFIMHLTTAYGDRDLDMESWYFFQCSMAKED